MKTYYGNLDTSGLMVIRWYYIVSSKHQRLKSHFNHSNYKNLFLRLLLPDQMCCCYGTSIEKDRAIQAIEVNCHFGSSASMNWVHAETTAEMFKVKGGKDSLKMGMNYTCTCKTNFLLCRCKKYWASAWVWIQGYV